MIVAAIVGLAVPAWAAEPPLPAVASDARIDRARGQVLDEAYQPELPIYRSGGKDASERRRAAREAAEARGRAAMIDTRRHDEPSALSSLINVVMWGLAIVLGVLGALWLATELARGSGDAELAPEDETRTRMQAAAAAILDRPLGDADELARRGEFAEAIHTLLLRTLHELARTAAVRIAPAMTSREVLARVPLLADARTALGGLITAVELTYFGDDPANAADYDRCRQQFHVFAAAFRGGAAARGDRVAA